MDALDNKPRSIERYRVYLTSHKGAVRDNNEDNFAVNDVAKKLDQKNVSFIADHDAPLFAAVFDGMGGESKGEYASYISAKVGNSFYNTMKDNPETPLDLLAGEFIQRANNKIRDFLEENRCTTGGSTVVAAVFRNEIIYPFSLGDSRIYLFRGGKLTQISKDQTLAMKKYEANIYTLEEAEKSVDSHKLTAFLGVDYYRQGVKPQYYDAIVMQPADKLLLCSDGLYDEVSLSEIQDTIINYPDNPAFELARTAIKNGGGDNVTCMVIERAL